MGLKLERNIRQITMAPELNKSRSMRAAIFVGLFLVLFFMFYADIAPTRYNYKVGDIAQENIKAPTDAVNSRQTAINREEAAKSISLTYNLDPTVEDKAIANVDKLFEQLAANNMSREQKKNELQKVPLPLKSQQLDKLLDANANQASRIKQDTERLISDQLKHEFFATEENLNKASATVEGALFQSDLDQEFRVIIKDIVMSSLKTNMQYDEKATNEKREDAKRKAKEERIQKGELIVRQGETITQDNYSLLRDLKLLSDTPNYQIYLGFAGVLIFMLAIIEVYLRVARSKLVTNNLHLLLLSLIITLTAGAIKIVSISSALNPHSIGYLVPLAMGTMLTTILFDASLAIVASIVFTIFTGLVFGFRFEFLFVGLISSLTGVFSVARVKQRLVIMRAAFIIAAVNLLAITTIQSVTSTEEFTWNGLLQALLFGLVNGLLSGILTIGILPFLESSFGILTPISLLELSNPNHPLLKKLLMEAPGTYHHSLIVGNLAESAAEMVGGDPLLCRVGGYFHDVGKSKRPMFFIENQNGRENPHDKVAPSLSHLIITSHVKDGVEMLEQYKLPKPIRDICQQHHGTTVLWYFYNKALENDKDTSIIIDDYRYQGPKPQTKEAAILMLCDSVEAAVRSMNRPTPNRIEAVIRKIIKDRLNDGQLDECDLTLKDLDKIADGLMQTLNGIYHARIEYPDPPKQT